MNEAISISAEEVRRAIDHSRFFIAEDVTPLFHTPVYHAQPAEVRLRYNQLHALYFNEQVAFFEQEMLSPALIALSQAPLPLDLAGHLQTFFEEEQRHTFMFRALNRRCAPELYRDRDRHFIRVGRPGRAMVTGMARRPLQFPLVVWLALLQEERSLYYSKECLAQASILEPNFVAVHRAHLADEVGHIRWDEMLLDWLWPRTGETLRWINARLLRWMVSEFFLLPKRSGRRVVEQLGQEFPELNLRELLAALQGLATNAAYRASLYSREVVPKTLARFDAHPEFALLAELLGGYCPQEPFS